MRSLILALIAAAMGIGVTVGQQALAMNRGRTGSPEKGTMGPGMMAPGLMMPTMDAARGQALFAGKGCVVCHAVNGVGGEDAPALEASTMPMPMNPFEFAAKMWRGAEAMVVLQREELGAPIQLTGEELADIVAFVHDEAEQRKFTSADIPPRIRDLMGHMRGEEEHEKGEGAHRSD